MELNFKLTEQEANLMFDALTRMPYVQVANLVAKIQKQADEQMKIKENSVD